MNINGYYTRRAFGHFKLMAGGFNVSRSILPFSELKRPHGKIVFIQFDNRGLIRVWEVMRMKLHIDVDENVKETSITIQTNKVDDEITRLMEYIERMKQPGQVNGRRGKDVHLIDINDIFRFYIIDKVLMMETGGGEYVVNQRLYQVEAVLKDSFIKISKSEIVNLEYVDHLSFTNRGLVQIFMKNGEFTYSSRRYLKDIKERLNL